MRKWMFAVVLALLVFGSGVYGMADTLTLVNVNPGNVGDGGAVYTYPYNFSINGSTTLTSLMCDDFTDDIYIGESWNVTINNMTAIMGGAGQMTAASTFVNTNTHGLTNTQAAYAEAAWLSLKLSGISTPAQTAIDVNEAVWELFSTQTFSGEQSDINTLLGQAQSAIQGLTVAGVESTFSQVVFYTPSCTTNPGTGTSCGEVGNQGNTRPQEFVGTVPEPGSLALLGFGLIGFGIVSRKRRFQA